MGNYCWHCFQERRAGDGPCRACGYDPAADEGKYPQALRPGTVLNGNYIVGRVLGQGASGITYLAWDDAQKARVAVKEFFPAASWRSGDDSLELRPGGEEAFRQGMEAALRQAQALAGLNGHPNIARIFRYFQENNTAYLAMEYVDGRSLRQHLQERGGRIGWQEALSVLCPVMDALQTIHEAGLLHQDITPANIYLTPDGGVKLLDFGAARYELASRSRSLHTVLTPGYAPKEQYSLKGQRGPYTDVYSVAACLYAAIAGNPPPDALERLSADADSLIPISQQGIQVPEALEQAVLRGLELSPADRFQSMQAFSDALAALRDSVKKEEPPQTAETKKETGEGKKRPLRKGAAIGAAAAALIALAVLGVFLQGRRSGPDPETVPQTVVAPAPQPAVSAAASFDFLSDLAKEDDRLAALRIGTVQVEPEEASEGERVQVTVTPNRGYRLQGLTVRDALKREVPLQEEGDGRFSFTMPAGEVSIEPVYEELPLPFADVREGDWYAEAVKFVYNRGLMSGQSGNLFNPDGIVTRGMFAQALYRLEGEPETGSAAFPDVSPDDWYAGAADWAGTNGVMGGTGDGLFAADNPVNREQMAVILYNCLHLHEEDPVPGGDLTAYADTDQVSPYAVEAMAWAVGAKVLSGSEGMLHPGGTATRAQAAAAIMHFCEYVLNAA